MTAIAGLGPIQARQGAPRRPGVSGFSVPETEARPAAAACGVVLTDLVALQGAGQAVVQDREARQHGRALLDALTALQRALLSGVADAGALQSMAALLRSTPPPADPALAAVQRMVLVRAAVELARPRAAEAGQASAAASA